MVPAFYIPLPVGGKTYIVTGDDNRGLAGVTCLDPYSFAVPNTPT